MSATVAIASLLAANGHGVLATDLFVGGLVDGGPDLQLAVARYDGNTLDTFGRSEQQPRVQVMVRGNVDGWLEAERKADDVWGLLVSVAPVVAPEVVVGAVTYPAVAIGTIMPIGLPRPLGYDSSRRPMFSVNVEVTW